jgi:hypothetical protein
MGYTTSHSLYPHNSRPGGGSSRTLLRGCHERDRSCCKGAACEAAEAFAAGVGAARIAVGEALRGAMKTL